MTTQAAAVVYPETDGMPLPDGEFQAPLYIDIVGTAPLGSTSRMCPERE